MAKIAVTELESLYTKVRRLIPLYLLPRAECQRLCTKMVIEEVQEGTVLFERGELLADWFYLLEGRVALEAGGIVMDEIEGNSEVARFPLAHQIPRKVTARALTPLRYVRIDQKSLKNLKHYQEDKAMEFSDKQLEMAGDWMDRLLKSPLFQSLPASNLHKILLRLQEIEVDANTPIILQGEIADCVYILRSGRCQVTRQPRPNARAVKLGELQPGDLFGEDALLAERPWDVSVTMLTGGVILRLQREDFLELVVNPVMNWLSFESAFREVEQGSIWLDVRDPDDYRQGHLEGSLNVPFFFLRIQLGTLQRRCKYITVCDTGKFAMAAAFLLLRHGFDAAVIKGGLTRVPRKYIVRTTTERKGGAPDPPVADVKSSSVSSEPSEVSEIWSGIEMLRRQNQMLQRELTTLKKADRLLKNQLQERMAMLQERFAKEIAELQQANQMLMDNVDRLNRRLDKLQAAIQHRWDTTTLERSVKNTQE